MPARPDPKRWLRRSAGKLTSVWPWVPQCFNAVRQGRCPDQTPAAGASGPSAEHHCQLCRVCRSSCSCCYLSCDPSLPPQVLHTL